MDFNFEFDAPSYFDFGNDDHDASFNASWFERHHPLHEQAVKPKTAQARQPEGSGRSWHRKVDNPQASSEGKTSCGDRAVKSTRGYNEAAHDTDSVVRSLQTRRREEGSTQATKEPSTRTQRSDLGHAGRAVPSHSSMGLPWQRAARDVYGMGNGESLGGTEEQQRSAVAPQSKGSPEVKEEVRVEEMIRRHNQKVLAGKCKYDENGRKIQSTQERKLDRGHVKRAPPSPGTIGWTLQRLVAGKGVPKAGNNRPLGGTKKRQLPAVPPQREKSVPSGLSSSQAVTSKSSCACGEEKTERCTDSGLAVNQLAPRSGSKLEGGELCPQVHQDNSETRFSGEPGYSCTLMAGHQTPIETVGATHEKSALPQTHPEQKSGAGEAPVKRVSPPAQEEGARLIEMIRRHNQKVLAAKLCKYDENGRRIWSGTPTFCPAPERGNKAKCRSSPPMPARTTTTISSCVATNTKDNAVESTAGAAPSNYMQDSQAKSSAKVGRCSRVKEPQPVVQTANSQAGAHVEPPVLGVCNRGLATGQKRGGETMAKGGQPSAKQKRRSCMPSIGGNGKALVSSGARQELQGKCTRQKRRSYMVLCPPEVQRKPRER